MNTLVKNCIFVISWHLNCILITIFEIVTNKLLILLPHEILKAEHLSFRMSHWVPFHSFSIQNNLDLNEKKAVQ